MDFLPTHLNITTLFMTLGCTKEGTQKAGEWEYVPP